MARRVTKLRIFVASPSDVRDERAGLAQIVDELNRTVCVDRNVMLELVRWETHVSPDLGRPQDDVNRQVGPFDVFIGIMWKRFGTPTGRAESGTEEEFNLALKSWKATSTPRIMFYFNQAAYTLRSIEEAEQIRKVFQFRRRVERYGIISEYTGFSEFKERVREHLLAALRNFRQPSRGQRTPAGVNSVDTEGGESGSFQSYIDEFLPTKSAKTASTSATFIFG
jgi:hypothetical protein